MCTSDWAVAQIQRENVGHMNSVTCGSMIVSTNILTSMSYKSASMTLNSANID